MLETLKSQDPKRLDFVPPSNQLNQKRQVKLKTCADVYEHWRSYKRSYKKAPRDGVEFQIDYIDTGLALDEQERARAPIALALHGAPGSYHDFSLLISHLAQQKVRVIAPNFPEYIATVKTKVLFRHSADEKAAYLRDFLRAINVRTIDLLVSHSSAIFPTLLILLNANREAVARQQQQRRAQDDCPASGKDPAASARGFKSERSVAGADGRALDGHLAVESLRQKSDQLPSGLVKPAAGQEDANGGRANVAATHDHDDDGGETFEDATDELDDNNNRRKQGLATNADSNGREGAARRPQLPAAGGVSENETEDEDAESHEAAPESEQPDHLEQLSNEKENALNGFSLRRGRKQKRIQKQKQITDDNNRQRMKSTKRPKRRLFGQDVIVQFDEPIEIKAVALFNPAGHRMPQSMKPCWFKCGSVHVYQHKLGRSIFRKFGPGFLTVIGVPVRVDNMDNVMLSATVMRNSKCQRVVRQLEQLSQMKIPTLLVFSENDKLIEKEIFYEMTQFMRLDTSKFDVFNNDGDIELSQSRMEDWIRVMVFKAGGHYAYSNYAKTVNKAVSELLGRVTKRDDDGDGDATPDTIELERQQHPAVAASN